MAPTRARGRSTLSPAKRKLLKVTSASRAEEELSVQLLYRVSIGAYCSRQTSSRARYESG